MKRVSGFTLIEVLVAIAIMSVMSVMAYSALDQVMNAREKTDQHAKNLADLQMTFSIVQKDLEQVVNRRTRDQLGSIKPALSSLPDSNLKLALVANNRSSLQTNQFGSRLQYVEYFVEDNKLQRTHWNILDRAHNSEAKASTLLENIDSIDVRFFSNGKTAEFWPLPAVDQFIDLPTAVELTIRLQDGLEVQRLFLLPEKLG